MPDLNQCLKPYSHRFPLAPCSVQVVLLNQCVPLMLHGGFPARCFHQHDGRESLKCGISLVFTPGLTMPEETAMILGITAWLKRVWIWGRWDAQACSIRKTFPSIIHTTVNAKENPRKTNIICSQWCIIIDNRGSVQQYKNSGQWFSPIYSESWFSQSIKSSLI